MDNPLNEGVDVINFVLMAAIDDDVGFVLSANLCNKRAFNSFVLI